MTRPTPTDIAAAVLGAALGIGIVAAVAGILVRRDARKGAR